MGVEFTAFVVPIATFTVPIIAVGIALWVAIHKGFEKAEERSNKRFDQVIARLDRLADDHRRITALADIRVQIAEINGDVALVEQKVARVKSEVGELRDEMRARPDGGATPAPGTAGD